MKWRKAWAWYGSSLSPSSPAPSSPSRSLPGPLRLIAEWNPVTAVATAARELFGNAAPAGFGTPGGWPAENAVLYSVLCSVGIIAVFAPLAIAQYRRISKR